MPRDGHVMRRIAQTGADVVHGHGAKGGAYARMALNARRAVRAYTPHGGSLLFGHDTVAGKFYLATEKMLMLRGDFSCLKALTAPRYSVAKSANRTVSCASCTTACRARNSNR